MRIGMGYKWSVAFLILVLGGCGPFRRAGTEKQEVHLPTVDNNACKKLRDNVVLFAVFVDSKEGISWSTHDIRSTMDSIRMAADWLEGQASQRGVPLNIHVATYEKAGVIPVRSELPRGGLSATLNTTRPARALDRWADKAARIAHASFPRDTARATLTKITSKDRERLIAQLRDQYGTDNVALLFMVNNYYKDDVSVAVHTGSLTSIEYAAIAFKRPGVIAHEVLHLFGALDLYITPFDSKKQMRKRKAFAMAEFPNEVMAFPYRRLSTLDISPLTEYLIGWRTELDQKYVRMLTSKKLRFAKY